MVVSVLVLLLHLLFFLTPDLTLSNLHSFPTRRSSDLGPVDLQAQVGLLLRGKATNRAAVEGEVVGAGEQELLVVVEHVRSEEHTSELQSRQYLVCRLLLEKKNIQRHHAKKRKTRKIQN